MTEATLAVQASTANETTSVQGETTVDEIFWQKVNVFAERWKAHHDDDLTLRHETGTWLNQHLGDPLQRQPRGDGKIQKLGERLGLDHSDISRMRKMAQLFTSVEDMRREHPTVTTWTKVRGLLSQLSQDGKAKASSPPPKRSTPGGARQTADSILTKQLASFGDKLNDEQRGQMMDRWQAFCQAVPDSLEVELVLKRVRAKKRSA